MHPSPFHDLILHGERLFHTGYVREALEVFESVIAREPHHVLALNNRGVILHSLGMYAEAEHMFLTSLGQDNNNPNTVFNLASMYIEEYNIKSAEDIIIKHGYFLNPQDINDLKEKLQIVRDKVNNFHGVEMTKVCTISMDVCGKAHTLNLCLNEREPYHRVIYTYLARNELYKSGLIKFLATVLRENDCFIDIGTHIGYFSLLGATLVGCHGQVFSFEPEEKNSRFTNSRGRPLP